MEPELLVQLKKKLERAQETFYLQQSRQMFVIAYRYLGNEFDASSVVNMAFLKVFQLIDKFQWKGNGSLEAWTRKIVVNESLMHLRRNRNVFELVTVDLVENKVEAIASDKLQEEDLLKILQNLPVGYRTVFNLYAIEGYSHDEIAGQLGITPETSRSQLSRARAILKGMLENEQ